MPVPVIIFSDLGNSIFSVSIFSANLLRFLAASSIKPTPSFISNAA
jgi:hypothetical protein